MPVGLQDAPRQALRIIRVIRAFRLHDGDRCRSSALESIALLLQLSWNLVNSISSGTHPRTLCVHELAPVKSEWVVCSEGSGRIQYSGILSPTTSLHVLKVVESNRFTKLTLDTRGFETNRGTTIKRSTAKNEVEDKDANTVCSFLRRER